MGEAHQASYDGRMADVYAVTARGEAAYRRIGDLRRASACAGMGIQAARLTGNIPLAQDRGPGLYRDGVNSNDSLLAAWGGQNLGFIGSSVGTVDEARQYLERSLATYRTIPSWNSVSEVLGDLAVCDLRDGRLDAALARLDEADGYITAHGLRGYSVAYPVLRRAQAWLRKLEAAELRNAVNAILAEVERGGALPANVRDLLAGFEAAAARQPVTLAGHALRFLSVAHRRRRAFRAIRRELRRAPDDEAPASGPVIRPERFLVRKLGKEFLVPAADIEWLQASGNYVNLHVRGRDYPLRSTMAAIEQRLDPQRFVRIHRSYIVNVGQVASIEPLDGGEARIHLRDGGTLPCSRRYREGLRNAVA